MTDDTLYGLLPAVYRSRDADQGYPLRAVLRAVAGQAAELSDDLARLEANWFIETCEDWLLPYFAELVGLTLGPATPTGPTVPGAADATWRRRQVANAVADRRRKGSFSVLEQLAADATGWPARAVELGALVLATPSVRLVEVGRRRLLGAADGDALDVLALPFSDAAPLADVRRVSSRRTPGSADPAGVVVWLWRLVADGVRRAPAASAGGESRYTFDQLGRALPLSVAPVPRAPASTPAMDLDVPTPISRRALARRLEDYYGPGRSLCVYRGRRPVPRSEILVADLARWRHRTPAGHVSIDPELGRIAFPTRYPPEEAVWVAYSQLSVGAIGGGHYERPRTAGDSGARLYRVGTSGAGAVRTLNGALDAWAEDKRHGAVLLATIEITDDRVYEEHLDIALAPGEQLEIRAAPGCRPILRPVETRSGRPELMRIRGPEIRVAPPPAEEAARPRRGRKRAALGGDPPGDSGRPPPVLTLDGIWIAGRPLELTGRLGAVSLVHCTLVPAGGSPEAGGTDRRFPSLVVRATPCPISIASSIVGQIVVESPEVDCDAIPLTASDSIIDAARPAERAICGADGRPAWASLRLERVTVLGGVDVHDIDEVTDTIFTGTLFCERRQAGSVGFSYVPRGSHTPRRTSCQPDGVIAALDEAVARGEIPADERPSRRAREEARVTPRFDAVGFGAPAYARLTETAASELARGAADEGELGAYHDLWLHLRAADLRTRLSEFVPAGTDIDIRFAT